MSIPQSKPHVREAAQSSPRKLCMVTTFEEWSTTAEPYYQTEFGFLSRNQRSCYDMLGQSVFLEFIFPANIFKDIISLCLAVDFNILEDSETMKLAAKHGAHWEEGPYNTDSRGYPVFLGDEGPEKCFNFLVEWRQLNGNPRVPEKETA